jgi:OOP family OmpA-OmpF porin
MTRYLIRGSLLVLVALVATTASANTTSYDWYAGGSYGTASFSHGFDGFFDSGGIGGFMVNDSDTGWKIFGGRRLSEHVSIEISYVDLNNGVDNETTFSASSDDSGARFTDGGPIVDLGDARATAVVLVGTLPLTDRATLLAKAGAAEWEADRIATDRAGRTIRDESGTDAILGAGFQYRVGARVEVRLDWDRYAKIAGDQVDLLSLGVVIPLGSWRDQ